jgi:hypothetical protein
MVPLNIIPQKTTCIQVLEKRLFQKLDNQNGVYSRYQSLLPFIQKPIAVQRWRQNAQDHHLHGISHPCKPSQK